MLLLQAPQAAPSGWENLRDWISAVGSLAAAVVAAVAFLWGLRGRQDRAWAELSHQARRVVAWIEKITPKHSQSALAWGHSVVIVQNNSEEPIHDCVISVNVAPEHWAEVGSSQLIERRRIVPPGRTEVILRGLDHQDQSQLPALWFTDSANVRWTRSYTGRLARVVDHSSHQTGWRRALPWPRSDDGPTVDEPATYSSD